MSTGLLRPFQRNQQHGFARGDALSGRIEAIAASDGELPWKPQLDSKVNRLRNQRATPMLSQFAGAYIGGALRVFEPGVQVTGVRAERAGESIDIEIDYQTQTQGGTARVSV